ncbi:MAG: class I SAM-dependent methyltransferase [Magnetococcales bacterium]|nr:class I SAM-dependent methyltransferase [Magnetococcales bacterium]
MYPETFTPYYCAAGVPPIPGGAMFTGREGRSRFVAHHFAPLWNGSVLDVGCFKRELRAHLPTGCFYVGIDLMGQPDLVVNLDRGHIPFADASFDVVVCVDVLEHLECIHRVFDELLRVSSNRVLVSLPNCWHGNWRWLLPGAPRHSGKYYGLPAQRPPDRHRWFFNTIEAVEFLRIRSKQAGAELEYLDFSMSASPGRRWLMRHLLGKDHWAWSAAAVWAVIKKGSPCSVQPMDGPC